MYGRGADLTFEFSREGYKRIIAIDERGDGTHIAIAGVRRRGHQLSRLLVCRMFAVAERSWWKVRFFATAAGSHKESYWKANQSSKRSRRRLS